MNIFLKTWQHLIGRSSMLEMVIVTTLTNRIPNYTEVDIIIYPSSDFPVRGTEQEHDPPHFHLISRGFDISISLPDYELIAIRLNRNKRLLIKEEKNPSWLTSGQISLRVSLFDWLSKNANEENVFSIWNGNNLTLSTAFYNFEQTLKYINKLIVKTQSKLDRDDLQEVALEHSFINREIMIQVFDSLGVK